MSLTKLTANLNAHQNKPDKPSDTAEKLKQDFDKPVNDIKDYINNILTEELDPLISNLQDTVQTLQSTVQTNRNTLSAEQLNIMFPIGYIHMSINETNPGSLFGGTWERIQGRFLVGAGNNGASGNQALNLEAGNTGGEKNHALSTNEIPSHNHGNKNLTGSIWNYAVQSSSNGVGANGIASVNDASGDSVRYANDSKAGSKTYSDAVSINASHTHDSVGGNQAHNNMPPYLAVYMWKRIA